MSNVTFTTLNKTGHSHEYKRPVMLQQCWSELSQSPQIYVHGCVARFQVTPVVSVTIQVPCDVTPCRLTTGSRRFE